MRKFAHFRAELGQGWFWVGLRGEMFEPQIKTDYADEMVLSATSRKVGFPSSELQLSSRTQPSFLPMGEMPSGNEG